MGHWIDLKGAHVNGEGSQVDACGVLLRRDIWDVERTVSATRSRAVRILSSDEGDAVLTRDLRTHMQTRIIALSQSRACRTRACITTDYPEAE